MTETVQLIDQAHLDWFVAAIECEHALHVWFGASSTDSGSRYLDYRAALDREEAAAAELERAARLSLRKSFGELAAVDSGVPVSGVR